MDESKVLVGTDVDAQKAEILGAIAQYRDIAEYPDEKLATWMTGRHKIQLLQKQYAALPGRFKKMLQKGVASLTQPPDVIPGPNEVQRFREGVKRQIEEWEGDLADMKPVPPASRLFRGRGDDIEELKAL